MAIPEMALALTVEEWGILIGNVIVMVTEVVGEPYLSQG